MKTLTTMSDRMNDAYVNMDRLIKSLEKLNNRGISKTIDEAIMISSLRKIICSKMDKLQLIISEEMKKG